MTDYTELVKKLRNRRMCIQALGTLYDYPLLSEAADAIEELQKYAVLYKSLIEKGEKVTREQIEEKPK